MSKGLNTILFSCLAMCCAADVAHARAPKPSELVGVDRVVAFGNVDYYHGMDFGFGTLTLSQLRSYCASVTTLSRQWHLASSQEIDAAANFISHGKGIWNDFSRVIIKAPGYVLVTGTTNPEYRSVVVYRLYGNSGFPELNKLGPGTILTPTSDVENGPLVNSDGNGTVVKVICVSNG